MNGILVEYGKIDSFIATLGVGTILYGLGTWYTDGAHVIGVVPKAFAAINDAKVLGIPFPSYLVAAVALLAWAFLEHIPIGRQLYAIGSNRKAAELTGIRARRLVIGAFVTSGLIVGLAGVILAARLQVAQSSVGPEFLLPAFRPSSPMSAPTLTKSPTRPVNTQWFIPTAPPAPRSSPTASIRSS